MRDSNYTLITGASCGFGKALAIECAKRGMNLILVALPNSGLPVLEVEIRNAFGIDIVVIEKDLCDPGNCSAIYQFARGSNRRINVLINNAGGGSTELFASGDLAQYERQIELNILTTLRLTHLFLDILNAEKPAYILNVGSLAAYFTVPQKGVYSASKSFILSFSKTLREELRYTNISVSVVCPSGMPTNDLSVQMIQQGSLLTRLSCMHPKKVARLAVEGMLKEKRVIVPGAINRAFVFIDKILPFFFKRFLLRSTMQRLKNAAKGKTGLHAQTTTQEAQNPYIQVFYIG